MTVAAEADGRVVTTMIGRVMQLHAAPVLLAAHAALRIVGTERLQAALPSRFSR
jgi:hypothetical protein